MYNLLYYICISRKIWNHFFFQSLTFFYFDQVIETKFQQKVISFSFFAFKTESFSKARVAIAEHLD
jgi:hypothetical protein